MHDSLVTLMTNMAAQNDTMELEDALTPAHTNGEPRGHRRLAYNGRQSLPGNEQVSVSYMREGALTPARTTEEPRGYKHLTYRPLSVITSKINT